MGVLAQRRECDGQRASREKGAIVRRRIIERRVALRPELDPVEPEPAQEPKQFVRPLGIWGSAAYVLIRRARKALIVNREDEAFDTEGTQGSANQRGQVGGTFQ